MDNDPGLDPEVGASAPSLTEGHALADGAPDRLLDAKQVAALLGIRRRTVYLLVDQGFLPFHRIGRRLVRFSEDDVSELYRRSAEVAP